MGPPSKEKKAKKEMLVPCAHESAYRIQPRQLTRKECENHGVPYGAAEPQWLCNRCRGIFVQNDKPDAGQKPNIYDVD